MHIDSRHPIRHRLPPGGNGERARLTLTWVSGYRRSHRGETTRHLFARSRTLPIKLTFGFSSSTVISISPLPAVLNYSLDRSDFHGISRAEGPTQLTCLFFPECRITVGEIVGTPRFRSPHQAPRSPHVSPHSACEST